MAIIEPQGLKGLRGLNDLSVQERSNFLKRNAKVLSKYTNRQDYLLAADRLYENKKFIDLFGKKAFDLTNDGSVSAFNKRSAAVKDYIVNKAFNSAFKTDGNYNQLNAELDTDGKLDLLNAYQRGEYLGTVKINQELKKRQKKISEHQNLANRMTAYPDVYAVQQTLATAGAFKSSNYNISSQEKNKELREKLFAQTQFRREAETKPLADNLYQGILDNDAKGKISLAQVYKNADTEFLKASNHYKQFKNSKWLKDYSNTDRLKDYAQYTALQRLYGDQVAADYLDRTIQNRVADAQDGKWTGNTARKIISSMASSIGQTYSMLTHASDFTDMRKLGIRNQGKDPNKPIYKKINGKWQIVDFAEDTNKLASPAYWSDVYQFNTFDPDEIKVIKERGGISPYVNIREFGHVPDFISWETMQEGVAQIGNVLGTVLSTLPIDAATVGVSKGLTLSLKALGAGVKTLATTEKVLTKSGRLLSAATAALSDSQQEAMGTFDEQLLRQREEIQRQIKHELNQYQQNLDYDTPEAKKSIQNYYRQLKAEDNRRLKTRGDSNIRQLPKSDNLLYAQAKRMYLNEMSEKKYKELQNLHAKDDLAASDIAASTYATNLALNYVKNTILDYGVQKFKTSKGWTRILGDDGIANRIMANSETGGVKVKPVSKKVLIAKKIGEQVAAGFWDEYSDGINAAFASGVGNNLFNNYINKTYNPDDYNEATDNILGNILSGIGQWQRGLTERQNLYEGFIGAVTPFVTVSPNILNVAVNNKVVRQALKGKDLNGDNITKAEIISQFVMNPIVNSVADVNARERAVNRNVKAINEVVKKNKSVIDQAATLLSTLNERNQDLSAVRYKMNKEGTEVTPTMLDGKDGKLFNAFTLMEAIRSLEGIEGGKKSQVYQDIVGKLQLLADGTMDNTTHEKEVASFLANPDNKSVLNMGEEGKAVAAERLQKNAKYLLGVKDKLDNLHALFDRSTSLSTMDPRVKQILLYNIVASDDYKQRLKELEQQLGLSQTNADKLHEQDLRNLYGTKEARINAVRAREKTIDQINNKLKAVVDQKEQLKRDISQQVEAIKDLEKEEDINEANKKLQSMQSHLTSLNFQETSLKETKEMAQNEYSQIVNLMKESEGQDTVLTEDQILHLDARDRAAILDPNNINNYSKEQQTIIKRTIANLMQKDPDALTKILDAGTLAQRVSDLKTVYQKIKNNDSLTSTYLDTVEQWRNTRAFAESIQQQIDDNFTKIEDAYNNFKNDPKKFYQAAKMLNSMALGIYIQEHPEQAKDLEPISGLVDFTEDIVGAMHILNYPTDIRDELFHILDNIYSTSNNKDEAIQKLKSFIDDDNASSNHKEALTEILETVEAIENQKDSTTEEKKGKSEKDKKKIEEEERKKAEEKAKEEAKKAAEEAKRKKQEEEEKKKAQHRKLFEKDLNTIRTSKDPLEIVSAISALQQNIEKAKAKGINVLTDQEQKEIADKIKEMHSLGYEWDGLKVGQEYNDEMKVTVKETVKNEELAPDEKHITEILKPQITKDGEIVQQATVIIEQGIESEEAKAEKEKERKKERERQLRERRKAIFNQLLDHLKKMGIVVHNKKELYELLKENGSDNIQAFAKIVNNYIRELDPKEYRVLQSSLMSKYGNKIKNNVYTRTANTWYLVDYFGEGEFGVLAAIPIEGNENLLNDIENGIKGKSFSSAAAFARWLTIFTKSSEGGNNVHNGKDERQSKNDVGNDALDSRQQRQTQHSNTRGNNENSNTDLEQRGRSSGTVQPLITKEGVIYGLVYNGEVYIDESKISLESPIHEYTHLWDLAIQKINKPLWEQGKMLMKRDAKELWDEISESDTYGLQWRDQGKSKEEIEDLIASEVHARLTGQEGKKYLTQTVASEDGNINVISALGNWLKKVYHNILESFKTWKKEDLDSLTLPGFINLTLNDFIQGINPNSVVMSEGEPHVQTMTAEELRKKREKEGKETPPEVIITEGDPNLLNNDNAIPNSLSGNAMQEWVINPLKEDGKLIHKQGSSPNDSMNKYYNWLKAAGIKLQNIVDEELADILMATPHAKVKFMTVKPEHNATNDADMQTHLMLVLDYDDSINKNITKIHRDENGGVITSNGKRYLIIGTVGYGTSRNIEQRNLYDILFGKNPHAPTGYGLLIRNRKPFFEQHPDERFYVDETITTEVIPNSLIPGYRVRMLEKDERPQFRTLSEILADKERNPFGYTLENLSFAIQYDETLNIEIIGKDVKKREFLPIKVEKKEDRIGNTFLLIKAGNGKFLPIYIKPLMYTEMRDGALKKTVDKLLDECTSLNVLDRLDAKSELLTIFYLRDDKDAIYVNKDNTIVLKKNGTILKKFILNDHFNKQDFFDAVVAMNPRINITENNLSNSILLQELDEAGALMTDVAKLNTAGSLFRIYAVDVNGQMIKPQTEINPTENKNNDPKTIRMIPYKGKFYRIKDGDYYLDGQLITDEKLKEQLYYNAFAVQNPNQVETLGLFLYVTIDPNEDNPLVVRIHQGTKNVEIVSQDIAKSYLKEREKRREDKQREEEAKKALKEKEEKEKKEKEKKEKEEKKREALTEEYNFEHEILKEVWGLNSKEDIEESDKTKEVLSGMVIDDLKIDDLKKRELPKRNPQRRTPIKTINFLQLLNGSYGQQVMGVINEKWGAAVSRKSPKKILAFLKRKNIEVTAIPSSENGIYAWIKTIQECR